jgi:VIT1/CCC1 family predicted Fe2+/Mn2+ transporter
MTRRRSSPRLSRRLLETRAPRRGTLIIASILYIVGLFGVLDFFPIPDPYAIVALAIAGGLLILGALLRDL